MGVYSDFSDVSAHLPINTATIAASSSLKTMRSIPTPVYNDTDLAFALADLTVSSIMVMNNITLVDCLEIPRDIDFVSGGSAAVTITSANAERHFNIVERNGINITFDGII